MIQFHEVGKEFSSRILFTDVTFSINPGEKVGLVGRNGCGKSTLFKMITGEFSVDEGTISIPKNYSIGLLRQHLSFTHETVLKECCSVLSEEEKFDDYKVKAILNGLGVSEIFWSSNPLELSGGQQIRLNLCKLLLGNYNMLLLDEPTNYLDIVSMRWLERFLLKFPGEILLITHDRDFMNKVVNNTMGIHRQKLVKVKGTFEEYKNQITEQERVYENTRLNQEKKRKEIETFVNKFRAKARQASLAQSRQKMLEKMEEFDQLENVQTLNFRFNYKDFQAKTLLSCENLSFAYEKDKYLFKNLAFHINRGDKVAIIGPNGKGKSTLLNVLNHFLKPNEGNVQLHHHVEIGHFGQTNIDRLSNNLSIIEEIQSVDSELNTTRIRDICGTMMFSGDDAKKKIEVLSGGEKSRVLLGKILAKPSNLLLLDEPTNHLDQESIEALLTELKNYQGAVLLVTHSEYLLRELAKKLIVFTEDGCQEFLGNYDEFLEKIGWGDDEVKKTIKVEKLGRKEYKRLRSELINERSKELAPLRKLVENLESSIIELESKIEQLNEGLVDASSNKDATAIESLSKELSFSEEKIDQVFEELSQKSEFLEKREEDFERRLKELELTHS